MNKEENKKEEIYKTIKPLTLVSQLGLNMMAPIFICLFIGKYLDKVMNKPKMFTLIFLTLGFLSAMRNMYVTLKEYYKNDEYKDR